MMRFLNLKNDTQSFVLFFVLSSFISSCLSASLEQNFNFTSSLVKRNAVAHRKIKITSSIIGDQVIGNQLTVTAQISDLYDHILQLQLVCTKGKCAEILGGKRFEILKITQLNDSNPIQWNLKLNANGLATLMIEVLNLEDLDPDLEVDTTYTLNQLRVGKSHKLITISTIIGYIYFLAWMLSLYPILFTNFKRRSVTGLNLDFVAFNTTGYFCYSIYNVCFFFFDEFAASYAEKFPGSQIPVQFNDVLFATHGFVVNCLICIQCVIYERGNQEIAQITKYLLVAIASPAFVLFLFFIANGVNEYYFISFFSYCKLGLTLCKYVPQAYFNYKRQSTKGWSIVYCFLDIIGGTFSILQMLLNSINQDDYRNFTGNLGKFGLGLISISFDILFIIQHYVLYGDDEKTEILTDRSNNNYGSRSDLSRDKIEEHSQSKRKQFSSPGVQNPSFSNEI